MNEKKEAAVGNSRRPNVIVILADDMGYGDLSAYGSTLIHTKHIDSIGQNGVKFTDGYSSAPLCSPSRAGLITGRYQQRFGFEQQVSSGAFPERREVRDADGNLTPLQGEAEFLRRGVPLTEKNLGEVFKAGGYKTGVIGKWHLGHGEEFLPHKRGFDQSIVFYGNTSLQSTKLDDPDLLSLHVDFHDEASDTAWTREGLNNIFVNGKQTDVDQYLMHYFRDRVVDFIEDSKEEPFMLYFAMNAPVPPLQVPKTYFEKLRGSIANINKRAYNALVLAQDDVVGVVLEKLKATGLDDNTIAIFVSDNGTALSRPGSNAPFAGGKYSTYEGGIRMPFMMQWPKKLKAGQVYTRPISTLDILPTVAAACDVSTEGTQALDGRNLLPYLAGEEKGDPHEALFWKLAAYSAVRIGKWKMYLKPRDGTEEVYNLEQDPSEKCDLAKSELGIRQMLRARYDEWEQSLPPRGWTNISPVFKQ